MDVRSLSFRTDLALNALAGCEIEDHGTRIVVRTPSNPIWHWGNYWLLDRPPVADEVDALVAAYDADFPASPHRAFGVDGVTDVSGTLAPLVAAGPALDAGTVLTATSVHPPPRPNTEAQLRPLVSDEDWAARVELATVINEGVYPADEYLEFATRKAEAQRAVIEAGHGAWWGAFVDGRLASA